MSIFGSANTNPNKSYEVTQPPGDSVSSLGFSPKANFLVATSWDNQHSTASRMDVKFPLQLVKFTEQVAFATWLLDKKMKEATPDDYPHLRDSSIYYRNLSNNNFDQQLDFPSLLSTLQPLTTIILEKTNLQGQIPIYFSAWISCR